MEHARGKRLKRGVRIPQADPDGGQGIANSSAYRNNAMVQIQWGLKYIKDRYGSLANAWAHEVADGWY